jgi:hypothetical protein
MASMKATYGLGEVPICLSIDWVDFAQMWDSVARADFVLSNWMS